jgi:phosphate-selective porin OprO/OprP
MNCHLFCILAVILALCLADSAAADMNVFIIPDSIENTSGDEETKHLKIEYGSKGWQFSLEDGRYVLQVDSRLQFRYAYPFDKDPVNYDDFSANDQHILRINRARLKVGGNAYQKWLKYYWEYELAAGNLLDFRLMVEKWSYFKIKVGQWKAQYNRERIISSGKQQMADRSFINRYFTIDRQQGISAFGRIQDTGFPDLSYWFEILTGMGRGAKENDDTHLMYMLRTQWNLLGDEIKFSGSDISHTNNPAASLVLSAVTNQSPYTRFSQDGGGQLEGFEEGQSGQYRVNQAMLETAFIYQGFSWQQEFHWKEIDDNINHSKTTLMGNYVQFGYFFNNIWSIIPKDVEIAFRHAILNPNRNNANNLRNEFTLNLNWFLAGHRNKISAEVSVFDFQETPDEKQDGFRYRLQWDVSL